MTSSEWHTPHVTQSPFTRRLCGEQVDFACFLPTRHTDSDTHLRMSFNTKTLCPWLLSSKFFVLCCFIRGNVNHFLYKLENGFFQNYRVVLTLPPIRSKVGSMRIAVQNSVVCTQDESERVRWHLLSGKVSWSLTVPVQCRGRKEGSLRSSVPHKWIRVHCKNRNFIKKGGNTNTVNNRIYNRTFFLLRILRV